MTLDDSTATRALRLLEMESRRWQLVLDSARDAIISIDRAGRITLFNRGAEEMFGYAIGRIRHVEARRKRRDVSDRAVGV